MKMKRHVEYGISTIVADVITHVVIKTVVDPLIDTFMPTKKVAATESD